QVWHAAKVRSLKRTALRFDPQPLHDHVRDVRLLEINEMKNLRIFHAPFLQVRIRLYVLRDTCECGDAEHVQRIVLLTRQFRPVQAHKFDADANESDGVDVRRDVRTGTGKADPATERWRLGVDAVAKLRRKMVVNDKFPADDPLSFGVPAALKSAGFPEFSHL